MTYCLAMNLDAGMVFAADTRTNAGVDTIGRFGKLQVFSRSGDRVVVVLSAGNLSITQKALNLLLEQPDEEPGAPGLWHSHTMFDIASQFGRAMRRAQQEDGEYLASKGLSASAAMIVGGQVSGERPRLFLVYPEGNFIESSHETVHFQIGEMKYGRPMIDQLVHHDTPLGEAIKCALVSFDWTMRSNISVGPPLHVLVYRTDSLESDDPIELPDGDEYFTELARGWEEGVARLFTRLPQPPWLDATDKPGKHPSSRRS